MKILAIETSCDETAAAVAVGFEFGAKIFSNVVSSQIEIHKKYGGVVPEVAAREHVHQILPVIDEAFFQAGIKKEELDAIAVTGGPGLMSSLQTGVETAKSLAYVLNIPLIFVNHIEGHIYANYIDLEKEIELPAVILTVSGGHTMIILMKEHGKFEVIGETRDDAAGEAFDKAAKLLDLGYPGGPAISKKAEEFKIQNSKFKISLPRPMIDSANFDFSFSGLKTAIRYALEDDKNWKDRIPEYAYEFQEAVVEVLVSKTIKVASKYNAQTVMLAGRVSANKILRKKLTEDVNDKLNDVNLIIPELKFTTDNAAMIASAGVFKYKNKDFVDWKNFSADCNHSLA